MGRMKAAQLAKEEIQTSILTTFWMLIRSISETRTTHVTTSGVLQKLCGGLVGRTNRVVPD